MSISLASWLPDSLQLLALLPDRDALFAATRFESPPVARIHVREGDELLTPTIDAFIKETLAFWNMTGGAAVAIVRRRADGSGAFDVATRGYGAATQDGTPITAETLLPIGSNSKLFCASSIGLLVSNSSVNLDWTSKVHQVLPEFALQDPVATERADLVDILSHRTGLPRHDLAFPATGTVKDPENFSLRSVKDLNMSAEFRQTWQYNNHMYNIGASLVANLSGIPYKDFVQEHLFDAAGFSSATLGLTAAAKEGKLAQGFFTVGENSTSPGQAIASYVTPGIETFIAGAGAVAASANDIALWLQVLLSGGKSPKTGRQVIPAEVLQKLETGAMAFSPTPAPELSIPVYGLALISASYQGHQYIEHGGALTGFLSQIIRFPNEGLGIAVLTNESPRGEYVYEAVKLRIAEELLGLPLRVDWNARYLAAHRFLLALADEEVRGRLPSPADAPPPTVDFSALPGSYSHPVYGSFELKLKPNSTDKSLIAVLPNWNDEIDGLVLEHYSGDVFNATIVSHIQEVGGGKIEQELTGVIAEFAVDEDTGVRGLGLHAGGQLWGSGAGVPPPDGPTVEDRAELWFEREGGDDAGVAPERRAQRALRALTQG